MPKLVCDAVITVRVPKSIKHRIEDCADIMGIAYPDYVRRLIVAGLENREGKMLQDGMITQEHIDARPYRAFKRNGKDLLGRKNK